MNKRRVVVAAFGWCAALMLSGCGGSEGGGGEATVGLEGKYFYQMGNTAGQGMTLELQKTGVATATRPGGNVQRGTYVIEGESLTVTLEGSAQRLVYSMEDDGNLATTFYGTEKALFVRQ